MSDNENNFNEQCGDECITCTLVDEFKQLVKDDVEWENALRHVLDIMRIEMVKDIESSNEESFEIGYKVGILDGIEQAHDSLVDLHSFIEGRFENAIEDDDSDDIDEYEQNAELDDEIIFDEEDDDDKIQRIIKQDK